MSSVLKQLVEAAGVEPDTCVENVQVVDPGNTRNGMFSKIAKSTVRSLYSHSPERPQLPNSTFGRPFWRKKSILKFADSISHSFVGTSQIEVLAVFG